MTLGGIGQDGALQGGVRNLQNVVESYQNTGAISKPAQQEKPVNADRVEFSAEGKAQTQQEPPAETPRMFQLFSEEIESAIGRIETIIKDGKNAPATGSMLASQKPETVNNPEKGVVGQMKEAQAETEQKKAAEREQEFARQSLTSPSRGSLSAIVETMGEATLSRAGQSQAQAAAQLVS